MSTGTKNPATIPDAAAPREDWLPEIAVFVAAILGRMPALGA